MRLNLNNLHVKAALPLFIICSCILHIALCLGQSLSDKCAGPPPELPKLPIPYSTVVPDVPSTGQLILNGRLMIPPFEISIDSESVYVNGINVRAKPAPRKPFEPDSLTLATFSADTAFGSLFKTWCRDYGIDSARALSCAHFNSLQIVDTAFFETRSELCVHYNGEKFPRYKWLKAPDTTKKSLTEVQSDINQYLATSLINELNAGCLVINSGGFRSVTQPGRARDKLATIVSIIDSIPNNDIQVQKLFEIVGDMRTVDSITHYFYELVK